MSADDSLAPTLTPPLSRPAGERAGRPAGKGERPRDLRRATEEAPWLRRTLIGVALGFLLLFINLLQAWARRRQGA